MIFSTDELIERLGEFKQQLAVIGTETVESADFHSGFDRVVRWKERVARFLRSELGEEEAANFEEYDDEEDDVDEDEAETQTQISPTVAAPAPP